MIQPQRLYSSIGSTQVSLQLMIDAKEKMFLISVGAVGGPNFETSQNYDIPT